MTKQDIQIMRYSINCYGEKAQIAKAIEECGELIVELTRPESRRNISNIAEEVADVRIMLDQLEMIFNLDTAPIRQQKLERLNKKLHPPINPNWRICETCDRKDKEPDKCEECEDGYRLGKPTPTEWKKRLNNA